MNCFNLAFVSKLEESSLQIKVNEQKKKPQSSKKVSKAASLIPTFAVQ